jgi:hypothetical protein
VTCVLSALYISGHSERAWLQVRWSGHKMSTVALSGGNSNHTSVSVGLPRSYRRCRARRGPENSSPRQTMCSVSVAFFPPSSRAITSAGMRGVGCRRMALAAVGDIVDMTRHRTDTARGSVALCTTVRRVARSLGRSVPCAADHCEMVRSSAHLSRVVRLNPAPKAQRPHARLLHTQIERTGICASW